MTRVMAQGAFDVLHPGHLHYLRESAALGDELFVVIARDDRVAAHKDLFMSEGSRRAVVDALAVVDAAVLGSEESIFDSVAEIDPDVITLGHDQGYDESELEAALADAGFDVDVVRIGAYEGPVDASSDVKARLARTLGEAAFESLDSG